MIKKQFPVCVLAGADWSVGQIGRGPRGRMDKGSGSVLDEKMYATMKR